MPAESGVTALLEQIQRIASRSKDIDNDQNTRAALLQLSRQLSASLEPPDEVVSLLAFSVRFSRDTLLTFQHSKSEI